MKMLSLLLQWVVHPEQIWSLQSGFPENNHLTRHKWHSFPHHHLYRDHRDHPPMSDQPVTHPPDEATKKAAWHQGETHHLQQQGQAHHLQGKVHHYSSAAHQLFLFFRFWALSDESQRPGQSFRMVQIMFNFSWIRDLAAFLKESAKLFVCKPNHALTPNFCK